MKNNSAQTVAMLPTTMLIRIELLQCVLFINMIRRHEHLTLCHSSSEVHWLISRCSKMPYHFAINYTIITKSLFCLIIISDVEVECILKVIHLLCSDISLNWAYFHWISHWFNVFNDSLLDFEYNNKNLTQISFAISNTRTRKLHTNTPFISQLTYVRYFTLVFGFL